MAEQTQTYPHLSVGASELATLAGMHKYNEAPADWWYTFFRAGLRSKQSRETFQAAFALIESGADAETVADAEAEVLAQVESEKAGAAEVLAAVEAEVAEIAGCSLAELSSTATNAEHAEAIVAEAVKNVTESETGAAQHPRAVGVAVEAAMEAAGQLTENNSECFAKECLSVSEETSLPLRVFAFVDGWEGTTPVELKTRRNRFFTSPPLYEQVQMAAIAEVTESGGVIWRQSFGGELKSELVPGDELAPVFAEAMAGVRSKLAEFGVNNDSAVIAIAFEAAGLDKEAVLGRIRAKSGKYLN